MNKYTIKINETELTGEFNTLQDAFQIACKILHLEIQKNERTVFYIGEWSTNITYTYQAGHGVACKISDNAPRKSQTPIIK